MQVATGNLTRTRMQQPLSVILRGQIEGNAFDATRDNVENRRLETAKFQLLRSGGLDRDQSPFGRGQRHSRRWTAASFPQLVGAPALSQAGTQPDIFEMIVAM